MLRLGRLTDYAVTLMSHMGLGDENAWWAASELADKSGLSTPTTAKVLKLLSKGRLVLAQRGASGGYKLARKASEISIKEVIEAMDGPIAITDCSAGSARAKCKIRRLCPLSRGWNKVNVAIRTAMEEVSLAEMFQTPLVFEEPDAPAQGEPSHVP